MCINQDIINRQWHNRNHDVFGKIARRQIRGAIRRLRDEKPDQVFSSSDEVEKMVKDVARRDEVAAVIFTNENTLFRAMINVKGYGYCRLLSPEGKPVGDAVLVKSSWIRRNVFLKHKDVLEVS